MCQKDSWYVENEKWCFNPVAHAVLCGVVIVASLLCMVKGILILPQLLPRARRILRIYIATQLAIVVMEILGLVYLKKDTFTLRLLRLGVLATYATLQYWSSVLRTHFFLEAVANTQQYVTGRWTSIIKFYLAAILTTYSTLVYILFLIIPAVLPTPKQRDACIRVTMALGGSLFLLVMIATALVGHRLVALIRTVVESTIALGGTRPSHVETASNTLVALRQGVIKTLLAFGMVVTTLSTAAGVGLHWVIMHLLLIGSHIGFIAAVSYLQTCKKPREAPNIASIKSHLTTEEMGSTMDMED